MSQYQFRKTEPDEPHRDGSGVLRNKTDKYQQRGRRGCADRNRRLLRQIGEEQREEIQKPDGNAEHGQEIADEQDADR